MSCKSRDPHGIEDCRSPECSQRLYGALFGTPNDPVSDVDVGYLVESYAWFLKLDRRTDLG